MRGDVNPVVERGVEPVGGGVEPVVGQGVDPVVGGDVILSWEEALILP